jgi:hypothetical protein
MFVTFVCYLDQFLHELDLRIAMHGDQAKDRIRLYRGRRRSTDYETVDYEDTLHERHGYAYA